MHINKTLLQKYFNGVCTPEEQKAVLNYLADENSDLSGLHQLLNEGQQQVEPEELPASLLKSLIAGIRKDTFPGFMRQARMINRKWWYTAAAAAVMLPAIIFFTLYLPEKERTIVADQPVQEEWETVINTADHIKKAVLRDGTNIWLTPGSSFRYSALLFGKSSRVIRLEGEAFFRVASNEKHPFIVQHGPISTHVLGTSFNVEAYADESETRVSLLTGRVAIKSTGDTMLNRPLQYLAPGQQLTYQNQSGAINIKPLLYVEESTYTKGWMVLDDVPLATALKRLEHQYHLKIIVAPAIDIAHKKVTAIFKGGTVQEILHNMLFAHHLKFIQKEKTLYIRAAD